ncbi:MAG: transcriptional regulator NrdR [Bacillota bacterium]
MRCAFCGHPDSKVLDSRPADEGSTIRRRRECQECAKRFTTYEKIELRPLVVVKKDGRRQLFDREKLLSGLLKACEKRPVPVQSLEATAEDIEKELMNTLEREIPSRVIGEIVMDRLRGLDEVAYVRFASVYREFKDLQTFMKELETILKNKSE